MIRADGALAEVKHRLSGILNSRRSVASIETVKSRVGQRVCSGTMPLTDTFFGISSDAGINLGGGLGIVVVTQVVGVQPACLPNVPISNRSLRSLFCCLKEGTPVFSRRVRRLYEFA